MSDLVAGLERGEFCVLYQPEVSCRTLLPVGVESLARWTRSPDACEDFIRAAERSGDIDQLGAWVLNQACHDGARWPNLFVAVNVSPLQFRASGFVGIALEAARRAGLPLRRLELEITESACFEDFDRAAAELRDLRSAGARIALDDFGAGYSSLTHLRRLPLDRVKIDRSFVQEAPTRQGAQILRAIVALGKALGLQVTAEGVETREQADLLTEMGCDCMQGFLFSPALSADEVARLGEQELGPART